MPADVNGHSYVPEERGLTGSWHACATCGHRVYFEDALSQFSREIRSAVSLGVDLMRAGVKGVEPYCVPFSERLVQDVLDS